MDALERLDKAAEAALQVLGGIKTDQFHEPTPCSDWNVQALMNHMVGSMRFFVARANGAEASIEAATTADCEDAVRQLSEGIAAVAAAWHQSKTPEPMANIAATEILMHGWDLARATGQQYHPDETLTEELLAGSKMMLTPERRGAAFGPEVSAPGGAPAIDRLAAFMGRQP